MKKLFRAHGAVSVGTLPNSIVWVTEHPIAKGEVAVHSFDSARMTYRASGNASIVDVVDRLAAERGFPTNEGSWREVSRADAIDTWRAAFTTSLAYGSPLSTASRALQLAESFADCFDADALFFRNGDASILSQNRPS
ncbi:MAG: hypothetical protein ABI183_24950 [Polyangiaceae bacterium]